MKVLAFACISWSYSILREHSSHDLLRNKIEISRVVCIFLFQIDALREVVAVVKGKIEVYMDGGVRTGNDVLKALALGARCIFLGRPILWGLACKVRLLAWETELRTHSYDFP